MNKKMDNKGFSLVELIIVIAIMAILVGVLAPQFIKYVEKSRLSKDMQNMQALRTAIEGYAAGNEGLSTSVNITSSKTGDITTITTDCPGDIGTSKSFNCSSTRWAGTFSGSYNTSYIWNVSTDDSVTYESNTYALGDVFK